MPLVWLVTLALLLRAVAPLGVHATVAAAPTLLPTATVTMYLAYRYDNAGRRTALTLPDGTSQSWAYDGAGRVSSLTQAGSTPNTYTVSRNGAGDLTTLLAPNGGEQSWSYDGAGRITGTTWLTGTTVLFTQTVTLDAAGQRTGSSDSWGTSSYGYDSAGRLTSASYPDGSTEADQYDAGGNRTVITGTTTLAGTNLITNTYDLADQLTGTASTQGNTTYSYDGNGNQTGSYGITGIVSNTYNDLGQLTNVVGPGTNVSYVYDGQGDRLRSYEQSGSTPVLYNDAQDLAGGLSDLVSDGTADYTYLEPGTGAAPVSAYNPTTSRTSYLASDVLGSVRLATDPTGAVIGAGAYDAWGVYQPNTGTNGATQLAGLQAVSPFGYAGQYYDGGAGTYSMRAREYNPVQGRFTSQDPQPYNPQVPVTTNPYEYAGDMVTQTTDPSGRWWVAPTGVEAFAESKIIADLASRTTNLAAMTQPDFAAPGKEVSRVEDPVPPSAVLSTESGIWPNIWVVDQGSCAHPSKYLLANLVDVQHHKVWDIENANDPNVGPSAGNAGIQHLLFDMQTKGFILPYKHYGFATNNVPVATAGDTTGPNQTPFYNPTTVTTALPVIDPGMQLGDRQLATLTLPLAAHFWGVRAYNNDVFSTLRYWWARPGILLWHDHGDPCLSLNTNNAGLCAKEIEHYQAELWGLAVNEAIAQIWTLGALAAEDPELAAIEPVDLSLLETELAEDEPLVLPSAANTSDIVYTQAGTFAVADLEAQYLRYVARKQAEGLPYRNRADYLAVLNRYGPGNAFDTLNSRNYTYNQVNLSNGKRLDSYMPGVAIISRKLTDFDTIQEDTFNGYLSELKSKYSPGTLIRSNKYPSIDGHPLSGELVLEVPDSNLTATNRQLFEAIAARQGVTIWYVPAG